MWPLLFQDRYQYQVELVDQGPLLMQTVFCRGPLYDESNDEVPYTCYLKLDPDELET